MLSTVRINRWKHGIRQVGIYLLLAQSFVGSASATWGQDANFRISGRVPNHLPADAMIPIVLNIPSARPGHMLLNGQVSIDGKSVGDCAIQIESPDAVADIPPRGWLAHSFSAEQAGKPVEITLQPQPRPAPDRPENLPTENPDAYRIRYNDPWVEISTPQGHTVLKYRHGNPDPGARYPMTSYIHPLVGLDGEILTDCSPSDHYHQRGLFWAWVRIQKGEEVIGDWWQPRHLVLEPKRLTYAAGPVFAQFAADHEYVYQPNPGSQPAHGMRPGERLFNEHVICRVFRTTPQGRAIDIDLSITALQDGMKMGGQTQEGKGYGGFSLRFARSPEGQGQATEPIIVADGQTIEEEIVNHLRVRWVDWTGFFMGPDQNRLPHRSGGAVFVHSSHPPLPASPPEWITRTYGLINVAYPSLAMLDFPKGKTLHLRYRIWLHRDDAKQASVNAFYMAYSEDWAWKIER